MQILVRGVLAVGLLGAGYLLGSSEFGRPAEARAQQDDLAIGEKDEDAEKIKTALEAIAGVQTMLTQKGTMTPATKGTNVFAASVGGVNAIEDLESGRGVDPETFAALYAGRALPEIQAELDWDEEGRLLYKNKLVRIYPISRLQALFDQRDRLTGFDPMADEGTAGETP